jgi:hypothetical protein
MNYYYDLPLELQNKIEDFLLIKPKDNELLNNEDEIEKQYHLYKTKYDKFMNKNKLDKIHDFNSYRVFYDCWDYCISEYENYDKYLKQEYNEINDELNNFQENFTKFITYQELYFKINALKKFKKFELHLQNINEYQQDTKKKCIRHNLYKIQDDSFDAILTKYMTELFTNYNKNKFSSLEECKKRGEEIRKKQRQIKYCFDKFKKYRVLNTTYEGRNYYTYKLPTPEEFMNDIELFKNHIKNTYFKVGKYYLENNYNIEISKLYETWLCIDIVFFNSIENEKKRRKIFTDENEIEYIKLTDTINIYANELNSNKVIS